MEEVFELLSAGENARAGRSPEDRVVEDLVNRRSFRELDPGAVGGDCEGLIDEVQGNVVALGARQEVVPASILVLAFFAMANAFS